MVAIHIHKQKLHKSESEGWHAKVIEFFHPAKPVTQV